MNQEHFGRTGVHLGGPQTRTRLTATVPVVFVKHHRKRNLNPGSDIPDGLKMGGDNLVTPQVEGANMNSSMNLLLQGGVRALVWFF